ncbi:unnamed protein product [Didymodactylos carnosus]|uniref:Uncharacterized protein n=1 Tax=Didymodactylos carnosus TaxID=1234261 RepID=A0A814ADH5_9BILA|nr:unnamed protein product [Didymodactylos carnosus]CAF0961045.1 unnamed protein product [Didymodactylos carnosus]CAF3691839.1 unnamed protein product [Didymodactylos carnosus]CAF3733908.1 unnamed protein product [Didymodactylos carnosus]
MKSYLASTLLIVAIACYASARPQGNDNGWQHGGGSGPRDGGRWRKMLENLESCLENSTTTGNTLYNAVQQYLTDAQNNGSYASVFSSWSNTLAYLRDSANEQAFLDNTTAFFQNLKPLVDQDRQAIAAQNLTRDAWVAQGKLIQQLKQGLRQIVQDNCADWFSSNTNDSSEDEDGNDGNPWGRPGGNRGGPGGNRGGPGGNRGGPGGNRGGPGGRRP